MRAQTNEGPNVWPTPHTRPPRIHPLRSKKPLATSSRRLSSPVTTTQDRIRCVSASRSVLSVSSSPLLSHTPRLGSTSMLNGGFCEFTAIRYSWRGRRNSRLAGRRGHPHRIEGTKRDSVYLNVQRPNERPYETNRHSIPPSPERPKSQSQRRERERPVVIGDPTVSVSSPTVLTGEADAVMVIYADALHRAPDSYRPIQAADVLAHESLRRTSPRTSGLSVVSPAFPFPGLTRFSLVHHDERLHVPQVTTPRSTRVSFHGPDDIPSQNSSDLRTIPTIPQEDPDDILLTPSPHHSQLHSRSQSRSRPHSHPHTPIHPPVHIEEPL